MNLYIDIDGVLLDYATQAPAKNVSEFIDYIIEEFDCYWLTTHCQGDSMTAIEYLSEYLPECIVRKLSSVKPTEWKALKTEGIDFTQHSFGLMTTRFAPKWMYSKQMEHQIRYFASASKTMMNCGSMSSNF